MKEEIEVPKSREEDFAESVFEWVKTERLGDITRFKEFKTENGIEYIVFLDNTRINSALLGDVVLKHKSEDYLVTLKDAIAPEPVVQTLNPTPAVSSPVVDSSREIAPVNNAIHQLLRQSKKKKQKVSVTLELQLPSDDIYRIVSENFENGDEEFVSYVLSSIDNETFKHALVSALKDKYTKTK